MRPSHLEHQPAQSVGTGSDADLFMGTPVTSPAASVDIVGAVGGGADAAAGVMGYMRGIPSSAIIIIVIILCYNVLTVRVLYPKR
jgi:hypothetical protein